MIPAMRSDVRDALRGFARNRGFLAAAILSLALGVGATPFSASPARCCFARCRTSSPTVS